MELPYIISGTGNISLIFRNKQYQVTPEDKNYEQVLAIVEQQTDCSEDELDNLLNPCAKINAHISRQINSDLRIDDGVVTFKGYEVHNEAVNRLIECIHKGMNTQPLERFLTNCCENPSRSAADKLYDFLQHKNLPITPDGCFLAYKAVSWTYQSKTSGPDGHLDNSVGSVVEVPRNRVDDKAENDCSYGLHAGTLEYVQNFGSYGKTEPDRIVIVKINPRDVVTVPTSDKTKLRCCKYTVVGEYCAPLTEPIHNDDQSPYDDDDNDDDDYDEYEDFDEDDYEDEDDNI